MKKIIIIFVFVLVSCLCSCTEPKYHEQVGWDISKEEFSSDYFTFYTNTIADLAISYDIDIEQEIEHIEDFGFKVIFETENAKIQFRFNNGSSNVGSYWSSLRYFHENIEDVFDFELYRNYLNFISDVNEIASYDYQEIDDIYYEVYMDNLNGLGNMRTFYYDSIVGYIGYSINWRDYYSSNDPRAYIHFQYNALLKVQDL